MMKCFSIFKDKSSKSTGPDMSPRSIPEMYKEKEQNVRVFSLSELREATNNFDKSLMLGVDDFRRVYKGKIRPPDGQGGRILVVVKRLSIEGFQGHKEWVSEVQFRSDLDHPNLVKLLGYCIEDRERGIQRLLVYEYMPNRSLEDHLFMKIVPAIPWITRLNIILGAAEGIAYLHKGLEREVVYRDFRSAKVLLDRNFKPKLSDFRLARDGPIGHCVLLGIVAGYADPEYGNSGHVSITNDIYSFGVVLYEILTGRRTLEVTRRPMELLKWVKQFPVDHSEKFSKMMDPRLANQYSLAAARRIAKLAHICVNNKVRDRPTISQVVEVLNQALQDSEEEGSSTAAGDAPS